MAITINWPTSVINIPRADMAIIQLSPTEIRELDLNQFRLAIKALEAGFAGMGFTKTHDHNPPLSVGGVELARTVEVLEPYTITFEDGQYAVNLAGANSNVGDRVNVNQVSVRSANSAGLVTSAGIEAIEYENSVCLDSGNSTGRALDGSTYPIGTFRVPVISLADARVILAARGFNRLRIISPTATLNGGTDLANTVIIGEGENLTHVTVDPSANVLNTRFENLTLTGTLDGGSVLDHCTIETLNYVNGRVQGCTINGTITLGGNANAAFTNSFSGIPGQSTPTIDMGGSGQSLSMRNYNGGIRLINKTGPESVSLDINSGQVILDSTVTAGNIVVRGISKITDNSTGTTVVSDEAIDGGRLVNEIWEHALVDNIPNSVGEAMMFIARLTGSRVTRTADVITLYEEDGVTVWRQYDLAGGGRVEV